MLLIKDIPKTKNIYIYLLYPLSSIDNLKEINDIVNYINFRKVSLPTCQKHTVEYKGHFYLIKSTLKYEM